MILVDTSLWIEFLKANERYFSELSVLIEERRILALGCVFGELLQGVKSAAEQKLILEYWTHLPKIDEREIWVAGGMLSAKYNLFSKGVGLIDAVIVACAKQTNAKIWTLDKKLLGILKAGEIYIAHGSV